jgi:hypothetical protein
MAGLVELPNSVVALRAVPDLQARLFWTRAFLPSATQLAVVPFPPTATHILQDQQDRDMSCTHAVYVTIPPIMGLPSPSHASVDLDTAVR